MIWGERLIKLGDSWFSAKNILVMQKVQKNKFVEYTTI